VPTESLVIMRNKRKRNQGIFSVDELLKKQDIDHIRTWSDDEEGDDISSNSDDSSLEHGSDEDKVHILPTPTPIERISLARRLVKDNVDQKSTNAHAPTPLSSFASLGISAPLQATLASMSIKKPTEVQAACIPPLLAGELTIPMYRNAPDSRS